MVDEHRHAGVLAGRTRRRLMVGAPVSTPPVDPCNCGPLSPRRGRPCRYSVDACARPLDGCRCASSPAPLHPLDDWGEDACRALRTDDGREQRSCASRWPSGSRPYAVRREAGIADVRLHDLRHTVATHAVMQDVPLPVVARLLGHRRPDMTLRYTHVGDGEVEAAAERVGQSIARLMTGVTE